MSNPFKQATVTMHGGGRVDDAASHAKSARPPDPKIAALHPAKAPRLCPNCKSAMRFFDQLGIYGCRKCNTKVAADGAEVRTT